MAHTKARSVLVGALMMRTKSSGQMFSAFGIPGGTIFMSYLSLLVLVGVSEHAAP